MVIALAFTACEVVWNRPGMNERQLMIRRIYGLRWPVLLVTAYWLVLFVATHLPRKSMPKMHANDKIIHALAYLWLAAFLCWAIPKRKSRPNGLGGQDKPMPVEVWAWLTCAIYGGFDELSQMPVGRSADWYDWYADLTGAFLGLIVYRISRHLYIRMRQNWVKPKLSQASGS